MAYQLKILAGANKGAMCLLTDGEYTIGTDEDCDLILADPQVAERHIVISVDGDSVGLTAASPVWHGEEFLDAGGSADIESFQPFRIGGTVLAVGADDAAWPAIDTDAILRIGGADDGGGPAAEEPADEGDVTESDGEPGGDASAAADEGEDPSGGADAAAGAGDAGGLTTPAEPMAGPAEGSGGRASLVAAALVAILAFMGLGAAVYLVVAPPSMEKVAKPMAQDPLDTVRKILAEVPGAENLRAVRKPGGRIDVEGIVESRQQVVLIRERLRNLDAMTSLTIKPLDELLRSANGIFEQLNASLQAAVIDGGRAVGISGYLPTDNALDNLKLLLARDLPGAPVDYSGVVTMDRVRKQLSDGLDRLGVDGTVRIEASNDALRLMGTLGDGAAKAQLATVVQYAKDEFGGYVRFEDKTTVLSRPPGTRLPRPMGGTPDDPMHVGQVPEPKRPGHMAAPGSGPASAGGVVPQFHVVVAGERKFVKDSNGVRYGLGDRLPDGFVVISIESDLIVTERNGNKRTFKIGR